MGDNFGTCPAGIGVTKWLIAINFLCAISGLLLWRDGQR